LPVEAGDAAALVWLVGDSDAVLASVGGASR
jgi:hypothetical protein